MPHWKNLLYRTDLTDKELQQIPCRSNENSLAVWGYYCSRFDITDEDILRGTPYTADDYLKSKDWEDAYHARITDRNILWKLKGTAVHREPFKAGRQFFNTKNTILRAFLRLVSIEKIIKEAAHTNEKFNNETQLELVHLGEGYVVLKNTPYPYFKQIALGHECNFFLGVMEAVFTLHRLKMHQIRELFCSARIQNIITKAYGFLDWECSEDETCVYINGKPVAEKIRLKSVQRFGQEFFLPEAEPESTSVNAVRVTGDFFHNDILIFKKGEIFNAPYCLYEARWNKTGLWGRIMSFFRAPEEDALSVEELERQITFSNQKLFEVQDALSESERRLKITEVYTRKSLVEKIRDGVDPTRETAQEKEMAVMFSDIRDFTPLAESMSPKDLVRFLNSYFNRMNEVIHKHNGEIDKLIGDCIMAGFVNSRDAVQAAVDMKKALSQYNRERYSYRLGLIRSGIGITYGPLVTGNIGSSTKMDYTMIGDPVNASSRLEGLTKIYRVGLLVSEEVKQTLPLDTAVRFIDFTHVKGKAHPLRVYEIFEYEPEHVREKKFSIQKDLEAAFDMYLQGRFKEVGFLYRDLISRVGKHTYDTDRCADPILEVFAERCSILERQVRKGLFSADEWDGIYSSG